MARFFILSLLCLFMLSPAMAQESAEQDSKPQVVPEGQIEAADVALSDADFEQRLALSQKMHEIWPVRPKIERALDRISEQIPPQNRLEFKAAMRKAINFQSVEQASIEAMADIFTVDELNAMIAFYGSKEGQSVSYKTDDYERALQPLLAKMLDKAVLDTKLGQ